VESGPAIFAGTVFALFGAALLGWTAVRVRHREPVALGVGRAASATVAGLLALTALTLGVWCFTRV
jgi:homoserine kinase